MQGAAGEQRRSKRKAFAFGRERRILRRSDFLRIQAHGARVSTPHFVLLVARNAEEPAIVPSESSSQPSQPSRLGVVVTKKIGHAPARNRIKRLCRECFRQWPDFVPDGVDLIVIARAGAETLGLADVREQWSRAHGLVSKRARAVLAGDEAPPRRQRHESNDRPKETHRRGGASRA